MWGPLLPARGGLVAGKHEQAGPWKGQVRGLRYSLDTPSSVPQIASVLSPRPGISNEDVAVSRKVCFSPGQEGLVRLERLHRAGRIPAQPLRAESRPGSRIQEAGRAERLVGIERCSVTRYILTSFLWAVPCFSPSEMKQLLIL